MLFVVTYNQQKVHGSEQILLHESGHGFYMFFTWSQMDFSPQAYVHFVVYTLEYLEGGQLYIVSACCIFTEEVSRAVFFF